MCGEQAMWGKRRVGKRVHARWTRVGPITRGGPGINHERGEDNGGGWRVCGHLETRTKHAREERRARAGLVYRLATCDLVSSCCVGPGSSRRALCVGA